MQKKSLAVLGTLVLLAPSVALANSPCGVVDDIKRHVTTLEHALSSGAVNVMRKAAGNVGVYVPGGIASASKQALILAIQTEEGSLRTLLISTEAACHAQQVADKAAEDAKKAADAVKQHICHKKKWPGIKFYYPC